MQGVGNCLQAPLRSLLLYVLSSSSFGSVSMTTVGSVCLAEWIYRILKTLLF